MTYPETVLIAKFVGEAYFVLVALLVGSFINLAVDRIPRGESIVRPRSHCRACGRVLNVLDLIPVAGYLIRGGRCATCQAPIGPSAPLIEAAAGACMVTAIAWLGLFPGVVLGLMLLYLLAVVLISLARVRGAAQTN